MPKLCQRAREEDAVQRERPSEEKASTVLFLPVDPEWEVQPSFHFLSPKFAVQLSPVVRATRCGFLFFAYHFLPVSANDTLTVFSLTLNFFHALHVLCQLPTSPRPACNILICRSVLGGAQRWMAVMSYLLLQPQAVLTEGRTVFWAWLSQ